MFCSVLQYIEHGTEESILLVETCLDHFKIYEEDLKSTHLEPVVASLFRKLLEKPHFSMVFSGFVRRTAISEEFLDVLSNTLQLSAYEKLGFGLALSDSEKNDIRMAGRNFCMTQFEELRATHASLYTADWLPKVLKFLEQSEVFSKHVDSFVQMILQVWLNENSGFILAPPHSDQLHDSKLRMLDFPSSTTKHYSFPFAAVYGNAWKNTEGELPFINHAFKVSPELLFAHSGRLLGYADAENDHKFHADHASHPWLCIDHLEHLCLLAEAGQATSVRSLLEFPLKHCPDVLLLGMAHVITPYNLLQDEVSSAVLPMLLKDDSKREIVLKLWHVNPVFFSRALKDALNFDPENIYRVINLLEELEILLSVLALVPMFLGIRLAALAARKEFIDLEEWLSTNLSIYEDIFFEECLEFLKVVEVDGQDSSDHGEILSVYKETAPTVLKVLQLHTSLLSSNHLFEEMESLYVTSMHNSQIMKDIDGPSSSTSEVYADDVETDVNLYFQQMFSGQLTVDAMVQMLTQFKGSSEKREQSVFECMINNLFEVYKFINRYPDEQLKIVAVLFGLLIRHRLVSHSILGISLQAVLDALHEPTDSKMFVFGTKALESFVDCLIEWPEYSQKILQFSDLCLTHPRLVLVIEQTLLGPSSSHPKSDEGHNPGTNQHHSSIPPANAEISASSFPLTGADGAQIDSQVCSPIQPHQRNVSHLDERHKASLTSSSDTNLNLSTSEQVSIATSSGSVSIQKPQSVVKSSAETSSSPGFSSPSPAVPSARFGSASSIGTLLAAAERRETPIEAPPSETQDRISLIINNLSAANVEAKAKEFTEVLEEQYYPWFGQYIVMKRASIEPNFHMLYSNFLQGANSTHLNEEVVRATYENCKVLLRSELIKSSAEERSLLKNLGGWLGKITIGRNRVLRARDIDPKSLLLEAYEKGLMIGVIPFISKILEPCQSSLAYQPPNPWTMGILGLLAEIHAMPNLKVNLKFEIEVFFKNLDMDLKAVPPSSLLKGRVRKFEGNPDFSNKDVGSSQQHIVEEVNSTMRSDVNQVELPPEAAVPTYQGGHSHMLYQHAAPLHLPAVMLGEDEKMRTLGSCSQLSPAQGHQVAQLPFPVTQLPAPALNLLQPVNVNPELQPSHLDMHFQSVLPLAMDNAIKEIISSIVQRSASIASHTTVELILKEYSTELDENCILEASCMMVVHLAGNLAYVTCKEPLRRSISTQLRNLLHGFNIASELPEQAIQRVIHDNLDLGCASIEKAAMDKVLGNGFHKVASAILLNVVAMAPCCKTAAIATCIKGEGMLCQLVTAGCPGEAIVMTMHNNHATHFLILHHMLLFNDSWSYKMIVTSLSCALSNHDRMVILLCILCLCWCLFLQGITIVQRVLSQKVPLRGKHREGDRPATFDPNLLTQGNVGALPEAFYPQSCRLYHPQEQIYEDFVPLPGQNSSQHSNILLDVPLVPSFGGSLPQGYALGEGQLIPGIFPSHLGNSGINATAVSLDPVDPECSSLRFSSTSSVHTMMGNNNNSPRNNENEGVLPSFPSAPAPQSHALEPNVAKELGIREQPLLPPSDSERFTRNTVEPSLTTGAALNVFQFLSKKLEFLLANDAKEAEIQSVIAEVPTVILRCISKDEAGLAIAQQVFECLYQNANNAGHMDAHLAILAAICDVSKLVGKELTGWVGHFFLLNYNGVLHSDDDRKFNKYITVGLIHRKLLNLAEYNVHMAKLIDTGKKGMATEFCVSLIQTLQASDARVISELHNVIDALAKAVAGKDYHLASGSSEPFADPPGFHGQVSMLLSEWCQIWDCLDVNDATRAHYVLQLNRNVLSKADDMPERFFHVLLELALSHYLASEGINSSHPQLHLQADPSPFLVIDSYADLVFTILKGPNKLSLLSKVLAVIVKSIKKGVEEKKASFCPNPYSRLFMNFLFYLDTLNSVIDDANFQVLTALSSSYHALQPLKVPAFSFAWLELVSNKDFMPKMLTANGQKGWPYFERLVIDLLRFMEPLLRTGELADPIRFLYKGTLRVLLVLIHDFPEFLCYNYFNFCNVIAPRCIQLRNMILSAFPKNMRIPDPNTPNLKVDLLIEMSQPPCILSEFDTALKANKLKSGVDEYLMMRPEESSFLSELKYKLRLSSSEAERRGTCYNVPLMNSLVLYVGTQAIQKIQAGMASRATSIAMCIPLSVFFAGAALDIFRTLILELDSEGRYVFFNAVANQLRYPSNHTHYFSFVMLHFFSELNQEVIQEMITRVLLERLITKRPHPWGALVTFLELVKNPKYNFWNLSFTKCAPEIENMFYSVSTSCGLTKSEDVSGNGAR
ncbi:CCR4-NOT transcription complex subunit 1-like [Cynara cardunculus var. scolymus]|uniref:CCR4-NOT transcription complex subunit 1-like n=1 Tax=Cynara cardunculus var. scolymus TaxID=59895 RepID=UPI000D6233EC|nr:CCR4-NOT transcription complex subunit 1-like [Cynara cardunculus var. scolymus]